MAHCYDQDLSVVDSIVDPVRETPDASDANLAPLDSCCSRMIGDQSTCSSYLSDERGAQTSLLPVVVRGRSQQLLLGFRKEPDLTHLR
jgi:hypothetical protein